jgi:hypothetical protein
MMAKTTKPVVADKNVHMELMAELYRAFDFFNKKFAVGLERPVITIASKGNRAVLGWFSHDIWESSGRTLHEINICGAALAKGPYQAFETLLHEMAHMKNRAAGIVDVAENQRHNGQFKIAAAELGLIAESRPGKLARFGIAFTDLKPETKKLIDEQFKPNVEAFNLFRREFNETKKKKEKTAKTLVPVMLGADTKALIVQGAEALGVSQKEFTTSAITTMIALPDRIKQAAAEMFPIIFASQDEFESYLRDVLTPKQK